MITVFYIAIFVLIQFTLACYVILGRWRYAVSLGDGGHKDLRNRIRTYGNFTEIIPLTLMLLYVAESNHILSGYWTHIFALNLLVGRCLHIVGLKQRRSTNRWRQLGMVMTFITMVGVSIIVLYELGIEVILNPSFIACKEIK